MARILVIDDSADVREIMSDVLEAEGYEVVLAGDGARGMQAQREACAPLVITDILMPNRDGIELIQDLREEFPGVKIIAVSGAGQHLKNAEGRLFTAREAGADAILRKPFSASTLLDSVREMLGAPPK